MNENRVSLDTNKANQLVNDTLDALSKVLETTSDSETIIKVAMVVKELEAVILKNGIDIATLNKDKGFKTYGKSIKDY
jgi:rRNA-processing protein FCF1